MSNSLDMISNTQESNTEKPDLVTYKFDLDENFSDIKVSVELVCCSKVLMLSLLSVG